MKAYLVQLNDIFKHGLWKVGTRQSTRKQNIFQSVAALFFPRLNLCCRLCCRNTTYKPYSVITRLKNTPIVASASFNLTLIFTNTLKVGLFRSKLGFQEVCVNKCMRTFWDAMVVDEPVRFHQTCFKSKNGLFVCGIYCICHAFGMHICRVGCIYVAYICNILCIQYICHTCIIWKQTILCMLHMLMLMLDSFHLGIT